jgi:hypothetical protein
MSNYFLLELDTTPPVVTIYTNHYTLSDTQTFIYIVSNEHLLDWQDIYIMDRDEKRYSINCILSNNEFNGSFKHDLPVGLAQIVATVKDEVDNSTTVIKSICIVDGNFLHVMQEDYIRKLILSEYHRQIIDNAIVRQIISAFHTQIIKSADMIRKLKMGGDDL